MKCPIEVNISERDIKKLTKLSKEADGMGWFDAYMHNQFMIKMCEIGLAQYDPEKSIYWMSYQLTTIGTKLLKDYTNP